MVQVQWLGLCTSTAEGQGSIKGSKHVCSGAGAWGLPSSSQVILAGSHRGASAVPIFLPAGLLCCPLAHTEALPACRSDLAPGLAVALLPSGLSSNSTSRTWVLFQLPRLSVVMAALFSGEWERWVKGSGRDPVDEAGSYP